MSTILEKTAPIHISYEIICEADLIPPKKAYFELLAHPAKIKVCTLSEEIAKINNIPKGNSRTIKLLATGIVTHIINVKNNVKIGAIKKMGTFAFAGKRSSFENAFKPSANGWSTPKKPTVLGPFLLCILLNTLRSTKVNRAIDNKIKIV